MLDRIARAQPALRQVDWPGGRFFQLFKKLQGMGRKALNIAPLSFSIERVDGQARFSTAAEPTKHDQLASWNVEIDRFEIVDFDAAELDGAIGHGGLGAVSSPSR